MTLNQLGISANESSRDQAIAKLDGDSFERLIARCRAYAEEHPEKHTFDMLKAEQKEADQAAQAARYNDRLNAGCRVEDLDKVIADGRKFAAILADPAWHFIARSERGESRSASAHYKTDRTWVAIKNLPVAHLAADDCVLFLWMVDWCPKLALEVIEAWGFEHKTTAFTWAKQNACGDGWHMGQGYWTHANPEDCWLATRGHPERVHADVRQLVVAPVMEHSRKPDEVHERIERLVGGPYLELYARHERPGWTVWGNEIGAQAFHRQFGAPTLRVDGDIPLAAATLEPAEQSERILPADDGLDIPNILRIGHPACDRWRKDERDAPRA